MDIYELEDCVVKLEALRQRGWKNLDSKEKDYWKHFEARIRQYACLKLGLVPADKKDRCWQLIKPIGGRSKAKGGPITTRSIHSPEPRQPAF